MKHRNIQRSLIIAAMCLGGTGTALAQQPGMMGGPGHRGPGGNAGAMQHQRFDPAAAAQWRLNALAAKLHLQSGQQAAWQAYSSAMLTHAKERFQQREKWRAAAPAQRTERSTPQRMEEMANRMRVNADLLARAASDTKTFYAVLTPEQQTIFDLYARERGRGHTHRGMHHRGA